MHEEVRGTGVRVMVLCPGFTRTEFQERAGVESDSVPGPLWQDADKVVDAALQVLRGGGAMCVPGLLNKAAPVLGRLAPRAVVRRVSAIAGRRLHSS